jgi:hypothetical protein
MVDADQLQFVSNNEDIKKENSGKRIRIPITLLRSSKFMAPFAAIIFTRPYLSSSVNQKVVLLFHGSANKIHASVNKHLLM